MAKNMACMREYWEKSVKGLQLWLLTHRLSTWSAVNCSEGDSKGFQSADKCFSHALKLLIWLEQSRKSFTKCPSRDSGTSTGSTSTTHSTWASVRDVRINYVLTRTAPLLLEMMDTMGLKEAWALVGQVNWMRGVSELITKKGKSKRFTLACQRSNFHSIIHFITFYPPSMYHNDVKIHNPEITTRPQPQTHEPTWRTATSLAALVDILARYQFNCEKKFQIQLCALRAQRCCIQIYAKVFLSSDGIGVRVEINFFRAVLVRGAFSYRIML